MGGEFHGLAHLGIERLRGSGEVAFGGGDFRSLDRCIVELAGEARQGFNALGADRSDDWANLRFERGKIGLRALLELRPLFGGELCQFVEIDLGSHKTSQSE